MKRLFDVFAACVALLLLSPLFAAIAIAIKMDSEGPVIFRQQRVGRKFRPFLIFKFRTMVDGASVRGPLITSDTDTRITRVGRVLRRWKIDELPQLVNVLCGDMSLVGPRPEVPKYVDRFRDKFEEILSVRPGLTDSSSIEYLGESEILAKAADPEHEYVTAILPRKMQLAADYVRKHSIPGDLRLLLRTIAHLATPRFLARVEFLRLVTIALDLSLIALAYCGAFALRFDGYIPPADAETLLATLPWILVIQTFVYLGFHLHQTIWRYVGLGDVIKIVGATSTGMIFFVALVLYLEPEFPRSVFILDALLQSVLLSGVRVLRRILYDLRGADSKSKRILIFGAGDAGEMIVRDMKHNPYYGYSPVGFIDDDPAKLGGRIHGVPVLGARSDLTSVMKQVAPEEVLIAMPRVAPATIRQIVTCLEPYRVGIKMLPSLRDLINGAINVSKMRNVSLEDLLAREPMEVDADRVRHMIQGRGVMVTGAGGSIGSELCRQLLAVGVGRLVMYERHENSLYEAEGRLRARGSNGNGIVTVVGDVCDPNRLNQTLTRYAVDTIFHAAAHKHVPMMELNPCEAVKNNVGGTRCVLESALRNGVEHFVLVSTDKAVNPSNVMGASKRVAELLVQSAATRTMRKLGAVRFGNVLGSNGSVVPRFIEQIGAGGPVTVTHPAMRRFFMLIPEAVQLILHASTVMEPGVLYLLEMGEQIKISEMARHLIRLCGFAPDEDIKIEFTGLRPGEKLYEELVGDGEYVERSALNGVLKVCSRQTPDAEQLEREVIELIGAANANDSEAMIDLLQRIVPTFRPDNARISQNCADSWEEIGNRVSPERAFSINGSFTEERSASGTLPSPPIPAFSLIKP